MDDPFSALIMKGTSEHRINVVLNRAKMKKQMLGLIRKNKTLDEIAEELGLTSSTIIRKIKRYGLSEEYKKHKKARTEHESCWKLGLAEDGMSRHKTSVAQQRAERRTQLLGWIGENKTLDEIAENLHVSREFARREVKIHGLRGEYDRHQKEYGNQLHTAIIAVMRGKINKDLQNLPFPERKAAEFIISRKPISSKEKKYLEYSALVKLFKRYGGASQNGEEISLGGLSDSCGIHFTSVSRALKIVNLPTLNYDHCGTRKLLDDGQRTLVERCQNAKMPFKDLARFTGLKHYLISTRSKRKENAKLPLLDLSSSVPRTYGYYKAFEVYEAKRLGFKMSEISELTDMSWGAVSLCLKRRGSLTKVIKHDLKTIYRKKIPERYRFLF